MKTSRKLRFTVVTLAMAVVPLLGTGMALASHPGASSLSATIRFTTWDNKTMFPFLGAIFSHMHKSYPNINVKIEPGTDSSVKLITQIATGTGPDVIQIGQQDVPFFVLKGALVDLDSSFTLETENLLYRHKMSPYVGRTFRGSVVRTVVRGTTVFRDGRLVSEPVGQLIRPRIAKLEAKT